MKKSFVNVAGRIVRDFHNKTIQEFNSNTLDPMEALSEYGMVSQSVNNRLNYNNANYMDTQ